MPFKLSFKPISHLQLWVSMLLAAVILLTRVHHFGTSFAPPDASLAVFFLAGLWIASGWIFAGLFAVAAIADQIAFVYYHVNASCFTPAYAFLIPAYGAMWAGGRLCCEADVSSVKGLVRTSACLVGGCMVFFIISNASFFWLSGYFANMSFAEYSAKTVKEFPNYLVVAGIYVVATLAVVAAVRFLRNEKAKNR